MSGILRHTTDRNFNLNEQQLKSLIDIMIYLIRNNERIIALRLWRGQFNCSLTEAIMAYDLIVFMKGVKIADHKPVQIQET